MLFEVELVLRMVLAATCGVIIGYERQRHHKQAGLGTFMIVALASAMLMEVSKYGFGDVEKVDASRIASQVVSGISFLGAGIIMKRNQNIEGLTTAAGIWAMAGIGLAFGSGMYFIGISCTILYLVFNMLVRKMKENKKDSFEAYKIICSDKDFAISLDSTKTKQSKVISYSLQKQKDHYKVDIIMRFNNADMKNEWEKNILESEYLISFEYKE